MHLPAIDRLAQRFELVAIADPDREAAGREAVIRLASADVDGHALLARDDVDAVLIATPDELHAEYAIAAARAGKHVMCEKPIAASLTDADAMIAAARVAGTRLLVGHSRRHTRRYLEVKAALNEGRIGRLRLLRENERRHRPAATILPGGASPLGKGVAWMNAIHETDLLRWFSGQEPLSVYAQQRATGAAGAIPDFLTFTVQFADGAIGSSELSNGVPESYPARHALELYGTAGAIRAKDNDLVPLTIYAPQGASFPGSLGFFQYNPATYDRQLAAFADAVADPASGLPISPEEARAALALAIAAVESAESGRVVALGPAPHKV